jgi:hypothetical protein
MAADLKSPPRRRGLAPAVLLATLLAAGCDGPGVVSPRNRVPATIGGDATVTPSLVGPWRRSLSFTDEFGFAHSVETTWEFLGDGSARRTVISSNLTLGVADSVVTTARWRVNGTLLEIDFVSPSPGRIVIAFRVQGDQLFLAEEAYGRVVV